MGDPLPPGVTIFRRLSVGYEYPEMYVQMFGKDYKPAAYIEAAHQEALAHRWYLTARHITMHRSEERRVGKECCR